MYLPVPNSINTKIIHVNNPAIHEELSGFLDAARWISAFAVLIAHLNNVMFVVLAQIPTIERTVLSYLWGFICGFAHWGVVVFFVLSGYLVGGPVIKAAINKQDFNPKKYLVARITRIYLVLVPVLIIGKSLDYFGIYFFHQSGVYDEYIPKITAQSMATVIGSILNLQGLFFETLGTNGPLATLANEFWYYMTFPLILAPVLIKEKFKSWVLFTLGVCLFISMSLVSKWHFVGFLLWCIGAIFSVKKKPLINSPLLAFYIFLVVMVAIRLGVRGAVVLGPYGYIFEIVIAVCFANILCSLQYTKVNWRILKWNVHNKLSGFSYSLYAVHFSLITFLCAALKSNLGYGWHDIPKLDYHWLTAVIILSVCISVAWVLSLLTEKHTYRLRNFLIIKLS